jgi:UDP-glucuronate 4-epimerase
VRYLVTGVAGFVGSTLAERLISEDNEVVGIDTFHSYYDTSIKEQNISLLLKAKNFSFQKLDICEMQSASFKSNFDCIFHLAGQPGVRDSWSQGFDSYSYNNVLGTQRVLDYAVNSKIKKIIYSSSSSIYGDAETYPTLENALPKPASPYGVSKLAGEFLCDSYVRNYDLSAFSLRYFTVYGPRQRPDMATNRLIRCALESQVFQKFGSGEQIRDFTFVDDIVKANYLAALNEANNSHSKLNIGGGSGVTLNELINLVEDITGKKIKLDLRGKSVGDAQKTGASIQLAKETLGWEPATELRVGLEKQVAWQSN